MPEQSHRDGEEIMVDDRVYQTESGKMYIDTDEFVRSDEGQELIDRFRRFVGKDSRKKTASKTMDVPDTN